MSAPRPFYIEKRSKRSHFSDCVVLNQILASYSPPNLITNLIMPHRAPKLPPWKYLQLQSEISSYHLGFYRVAGSIHENSRHLRGSIFLHKHSKEESLHLTTRNRGPCVSEENYDRPNRFPNDMHSPRLIVLNRSKQTERKR
jgi:hypothetical protein